VFESHAARHVPRSRELAEQCREAVVPSERMKIHQCEGTTALKGRSPFWRDMTGSQAAAMASH
jgi:hypothetical protein